MPDGQNDRPTFEYDSPEWRSAQEMISGYQDSIERIRNGRIDVGYKLIENYSEITNSILTISFTLASGFIALSTLSDFTTRLNQPLFWVGTGILLFTGVFILIQKKSAFENDAIKSTDMGYETEYYLLVLRNRVQDVLKGRSFLEEEFNDAKEKVIKRSLEDIDKGYEEASSIDTKLDTATVLFLTGLCAVGLSAIKNSNVVMLIAVVLLLLMILLLFSFNHATKRAKKAIKKRQTWLKKIKTERNRN